MATLFNMYDVPAQKGNEIMIPSDLPTLYVSDSNEVYCFTGILLNDDERHQISLYTQPYYMHGKHSTDKKFAARIKGFFRIASGCIMLDKFVDDQYGDNQYKEIDAFLRLPVAADIYYGVAAAQETEALTRAVFGLTCHELTSLLEGYAKTLGKYTMYTQYPRLTRSVRSSNYCELTGLWIPEQFPYITFAESGYAFSHVSLWGFYRHTQLLMEKAISSRFGQALLASGVEETTLKALLDIDDFLYQFLPKVTKHTLTTDFFR